MPSAALILQFVSTLCIFSALALFVLWFLRRVADSYKQGLVVFQHLEVTEKPTGLWRLAAPPNIAVIALLPIVENWKQKQRMGQASFLEEWDRKLVRGGLRSQISPQQFLALSVLFGLALSVFLTPLALLLGFGQGGILVVFLISASTGFVMPGVMLNNIVANRISAIEKQLPFAIEFALLSMEARAAFPAALEIYCEQMRTEPLSVEFMKVLKDIQYGLSIQMALSNLASRLQSDELSAFVLAVDTTLEMGQPIKQVLRVQADVARTRRYQSAEEIAKTASTRAIFPLFIVAMAVVLLLIGPLIIRLLQHSLF